MTIIVYSKYERERDSLGGEGGAEGDRELAYTTSKDDNLPENSHRTQGNCNQIVQ